MCKGQPGHASRMGQKTGRSKTSKNVMKMATQVSARSIIYCYSI